MKRVLQFLLVFLLIGCGFSRPPVRSVSGNIIQQRSDEKHEILIVDPAFQSWMVSNARPVGFYSLQFYETRNRADVVSWNTKARSSNGPITNEILYDPSEHYGIDVNYQLFWYFRYIESIYGQNYLSS